LLFLVGGNGLSALLGLRRRADSPHGGIKPWVATLNDSAQPVSADTPAESFVNLARAQARLLLPSSLIEFIDPFPKLIEAREHVSRGSHGICLWRDL